MPTSALNPRADISVIVPAYRSEATIRRALTSVGVQSLRPREVVVVDDGSDDRTTQAAEACTAVLSDIDLKIFRQANGGAGAARNRALLAASGEFVAFLDADDEWLPTKLERSLFQMQTSGATLVAHDYTSICGAERQTVNCTRHYNAGRDPIVAQVLRGYIATSTVVAKRDLVVRAGGFDPSLRSGQDYELWLAVGRLPGTCIHVFPEALTLYHVSASGISGNIELRRRLALEIMKRHWSLLQERSRQPLLLAWLRTVIIHAQAAQAHAARREFGAATLDILRTPASLMDMLLSMQVPPCERPNYLADALSAAECERPT